MGFEWVFMLFIYERKYREYYYESKHKWGCKLDVVGLNVLKTNKLKEAVRFRTASFNLDKAQCRLTSLKFKC